MFVDFHQEVIREDVVIFIGIVSLVIVCICLLSCFCPSINHLLDPCYIDSSPANPKKLKLSIDIEMGSVLSSSPTRPDRDDDDDLVSSSFSSSSSSSSSSCSSSSSSSSHHSLLKGEQGTIASKYLNYDKMSQQTGLQTKIQKIEKKEKEEEEEEGRGMRERKREEKRERVDLELRVEEEREKKKELSKKMEISDLGCIVHPVTKLDTLSGVALQYDVSIADIKKVNKLYRDRDIFMKDTLLIPVDPLKYAQKQENLEKERRKEKIEQFSLRVSVSKEIAEGYLAANFWNLSKSLSAFDADVLASSSSSSSSSLLDTTKKNDDYNSPKTINKSPITMNETKDSKNPTRVRKLSKEIKDQ